MKTSESKSTDKSTEASPSFLRRKEQPFFKPAIIQSKLRIGRQGDKYEQEADRVANAVVSGTESQIQRQSVEEEEELQMKSDSSAQSDGAGYAGGEVSSRIKSSSGHGSKLPKKVQSEMGKKVGADFSNVNIHTDSEAARLNKMLGARAFTHGSDIFFNEGEYNPASKQGKHLLAHELMHVVQQGNRQEGLTLSKQYEIIQRYPNPESPNFWENLRRDADDYADDLVSNNDRALNQLARDLSGRDSTSPSGAIAIDLIDFTLDVAQATPATKLGFKLLQRLYDHLTSVRSGTLEFALFSREVANATQALQDSIPNDWSEVNENSPEVFKELQVLMDAETDTNRQAKRTEAVNLLRQADAGMPDYRTIMQKLIQGWVGGAQDQTVQELTVDLPDPEGLTAGYLRIYANITVDSFLNYRSHSFLAINIDDIDLPTGTKEALKTAWGKNYYLDELPFPGKIHLNMGSTMVILRKDSRESTEDLEGWEARVINVDDRFADQTIENRKQLYFEHIRPRVEHLQADD